LEVGTFLIWGRAIYAEYSVKEPAIGQETFCGAAAGAGEMPRLGNTVRAWPDFLEV